MRNFRSSSSAAPPALRSARPRTRRTRRNPIPPIRRLSRSLGGRTSVYRGVTRHIWTGKYEAHIWDKQTWNHLKNRKGRQGVYLGAFEDEEAAAHVHDLAALKFYGPDTVLNFPANTYKKDFEEMKNLGREEFLVALKRKSSGFARGESKYRGVARHQQNGRWEARIGRLLGNRNPYLGTYETEEEAAAAYDLAAIQHRGLNAVTNFHISNYIKNDEIHQLQQLPQQEQQEQAMNAATDFDITNFIGNAPVQPLQQQEQAMNTAVNNFNIHHYMENAQLQPLLHQQGQAMNAAVNNFYIGQYTENAQVEALKQMQQEQEEQQATLQFTELQQEIAQLQINNQELPNPVNHHQPLVIDPVEEQPWRVSMDSEFNPFLAPDVGLEGSSELPGLFNDASFEENIEIFFGEEGNGNSLDGIYEN